MEVFETDKNNQQPSSKAESARDGFTSEELYAKGEERRKAGDLSGALMWYEKAAEQGDVRVQFCCGDMYLAGIGMARDKAKALMWYEKAAGQGSVGAQCQCGDMYYRGEGTAQDKAKALMWYEKAAEQGNARAQMQKAQMQKYEMTQSHYEELQKELNDCKTTRTAEVKKKIYEARLLGDLSENEAYDEAKNEEWCLRDRIKKIEEILQRAVIVEESAVD